jgi:1A family penicillin-binding protein
MIKKKTLKKIKKYITKDNLKSLILWAFLVFFIFGGIFIVWATTISLPDLNSFEERRVAQTTKIYDRTGEIVLYDVFGEVKRTVVPLEEMSEEIKQAIVAVEDQDFYEHNGIQISAIFQAILNNLKSGNLLGGQGGSTITQQVLKNALLTREKKISRKLKEWVLAPRLEKVLDKDEILEIYLNEIPFGGSVYGIQEAARRFFGKDAIDLDLVESAYLAGLPQAPTYYSPYGNNLQALEARKNHVLDQMVKSGFISESEARSAKNVKVEFEKPQEYGIKAPHFVLYVRELLEKEYGKDLIEQGGLKVTTTLDWELQKEAEEIVKRRALQNKEDFDAENAALVASDPTNGDILVMVGSRDYFDEEIDGNFNIATANRQPGSTFKPIVYAEAFNKGYRPETVVFDLSTEFSSSCKDDGECYRPVNYDNAYRGPMSLRDALAQSVNVPAVKTLYLAGLRDSLLLARSMGIDTLTNVDQYGLTLVLGGGEVSPLDMTEVYGVFATEGIRRDLTGILKVEDSAGNVIFEKDPEENKGEQVMSEQTARLINDVLSDNVARTPAFGSNSPLNFTGRDVAAKTGTTNDYRDAWTIGYTPNLVVTAWAGNNDNRSMDKKVAGFIITPIWNEFMQIALDKIENQNFNNPDPITPGIKPIIAGYWKGEETAVFDVNTGEPATDDTPEEDRVTAVVGSAGEGIHSILHWVNKADPLGPYPRNPAADSQYAMWEEAVRRWTITQNISDDVDVVDPDDIMRIELRVDGIRDGGVFDADEVVYIKASITDGRNITGNVIINGELAGSLGVANQSFIFMPQEMEEGLIKSRNTLKIEARDSEGNEYEEEFKFFIN